MRAYRIEETAEGPRGRLVEVETDDLDAGDVVLRVHHAGVNYKDALAGTGRAPIVRRYPCIGGIEAVGEVEESADPAFRPGDRVIAHGRGLGVQHDGGFCERLRCPGRWLVPLPAGLSLREAAALGVAGHSAALAVDRLERLGVAPDAGPVAVTGASGGVGALGVAMLARRGFAVTAVTSKPDRADWLRRLGAAEVVAPPQPSRRPLERAQWAGAIDAAGGSQLEWLLRTAAPGAAVAAIGNAAGIELATTVLPFILRGVTLTGINADTPPETRRRIWDRLAGDLKPDGLDELARDIALGDLPAFMEEMVAGRTTGRTLIRFAAAGPVPAHPAEV